MKKLFLSAILFSLAPASFAASQDVVGTCVTAALKKHPGVVTSLRGEIEKGKFQYELDIAGNDGKNWEVECDGKNGNITDSEGEVAGNDPAFVSKAKVSLDAAIKAALAKSPGAVVKIEYEIESDGVAYEFDIVAKDGRALEVEVNALTGEVGIPEEVLYQIGR